MSSEENESNVGKCQITVLKYMSKEGTAATNPRQFQIAELAELTGLRDEKEVQRSLYILEGHKLVTPCPEGDFTSKTWQITSNGIAALKNLDESNMTML